MSDVADPPVPSPAPRMRRARSATESLLSIVLGLEAVLVFFVALALFSLGKVSPAVALGGGAALIVVLLLAGRTLRYAWGVWFGWFLQALLIATGFLLSLMFYIGAGFACIWIYCFIVGQRLDRRNAAIRAGVVDSSGHSDSPSTRSSPTEE